jgi:hypothetical protein
MGAMMGCMHRMPIVVVLLSLASGVHAEEPTPMPSESAPSVVSIGARGGVNAAFAGFPLVGLSAGLTGRLRFTELVSLEPHVDGVVDQFVLVAFVQGQIGAPVVLTLPTSDRQFSTHVGAGPVVGSGILLGFTDAPRFTLVGGEAVGGVDWRMVPSLDLRFQARLWAMTPIDAAIPFVGAMATLGVMYGL